MSSKSNTSNDADSVANQPLLPKARAGKDYEAAVGKLMASYGSSGGVPTLPPKKVKPDNGKPAAAKDKGGQCCQQ